MHAQMLIWDGIGMMPYFRCSEVVANSGEGRRVSHYDRTMMMWTLLGWIVGWIVAGRSQNYFRALGRRSRKPFWVTGGGSALEPLAACRPGGLAA
jgi:hypothetical protein